MKTLLALALSVPLLCQGAATTGVGRLFFTTGYRQEAPPCDVGELWLSIPHTNVSTSANWAIGTYVCQKIQNLSTNSIRIKTLSFQAYATTNSTFTGYVRTSPNMSTGTNYGVASISTNMWEGPYYNLTWAYGTGPIIPPLTDFYVGAVVTGANCTKHYVAQNGNYYLDTSYSAYNNGSPQANNDYFLDIYTCP